MLPQEYMKVKNSVQTMLKYLHTRSDNMICEMCERAKKLHGNGLESPAKRLHEKCIISVEVAGKKQKCECECNFTVPLIEQLKSSTIADFHPRTWLSTYHSPWIEHLLMMGLFYYFLGLLLSYGISELNQALFGYEERYSPRSLVFILEASPFEESIFFGIPFYATGNQYVLIGTGILWTLVHLFNTEPDEISFSNLAYANFAFTILPFFFAYRTWKSGKGWFSILFHAVWDLSIFYFLILANRTPVLIFSNDSYVYVELLLLLVIPILLAVTYWLYKRRQKMKPIASI